MAKLPRISTSNCPFRNLLVKKVQFDKKYTIKQLENWLNVPAKTIYNYLGGRSYFPPGLITRLYNGSGDIDFLHVIVNDTDQKLNSKSAVSDKESGALELQDVVVAIGKMTEAYRNSVVDNYISENELKKIKSRINKARRELDELEHCVQIHRK